MTRVFVPSFQDTVLEQCFTAMEDHEPGSLRKVVVLDNGLGRITRLRWWSAQYLLVPVPYVAAQAFNIGFAAFPHDDIVVIGDDSMVTTPNWLSRIEELFAFWPAGYGLLTFAEPSTAETYGEIPPPFKPLELPTVALASGIAIPRRVLNDVGPWDEALVGYGFDDFDYGLRLLHAGYRLGVAGDVVLHTERQASGWQERLGSYEAVLEKQDVNARVFHQKWSGTIPQNLRDIQRPMTAEHLGRASCRCLNNDWGKKS